MGSLPWLSLPIRVLIGLPSSIGAQYDNEMKELSSIRVDNCVGGLGVEAAMAECAVVCALCIGFDQILLRRCVTALPGVQQGCRCVVLHPPLLR